MPRDHVGGAPPRLGSGVVGEPTGPELACDVAVAHECSKFEGCDIAKASSLDSAPQSDLSGVFKVSPQLFHEQHHTIRDTSDRRNLHPAYACFCAAIFRGQ